MSQTVLDASAAWIAPPRPCTVQGTLRRVGIEVEFNGLSVDAAADLVRHQFGGTFQRHKPNAITIHDTSLGDFECEIDARFTHRRISNRHLAALRDEAARLSTALVPVEIVCPPIPWPDAHHIDRLVRSLAAAGAEGTREAPLYAYGVQLNPELPSLDVHTIRSTFRAFLLLRQWLRDEIDIDPSRRLLRFEAAFPTAYRRTVLDPGYQPDLAQFTEDYLTANPTRNRELDLLPLLAHLDEDRVRRALPDETINPRPTWHYRLPNADFGQNGWSVGAEWQRWVAIERLAADPALMDVVRRSLDEAGQQTLFGAKRRDCFDTSTLRDVINRLTSDTWLCP